MIFPSLFTKNKISVRLKMSIKNLICIGIIMKTKILHNLFYQTFRFNLIEYFKNVL